MGAGILAVTLVGAVASTCSLLAMRDARRLKHRGGHSPWAIVAFWATVSSYMISFTALRLLHGLGLEDVGLMGAMFHVQTFCGASTLISLAYIMLGVLLGHQWSRLGAEIAGAVALVTVTLVLALGLDGPRHDAWSYEFIPSSAFVRTVIATFYVAAPVAMGALVMRATAKDGRSAFRKRSLLFSTSVMLMYVPNAGKYVTFVTGELSLALAVIMMIGTVIGWRSYHVT